MGEEYTTAELECYLDEALSSKRMAQIEASLRKEPAIGKRLAAILGRRDAGLHSLGEIWRRHRVSCPSRQQLGSFLLGVMDEPQADYVRFHLEEVGCRVCEANLEDMNQKNDDTRVVDQRRGKYFRSSAGLLPPNT